MQKYELTIVIPKATPAKKKAIEVFVEKIAKVAKGTVGKVDDWGEIELAYPISKNQTGSFMTFALELEKGQAPYIDNQVRLNDEVVRHLLVK